MSEEEDPWVECLVHVYGCEHSRDYPKEQTCPGGWGGTAPAEGHRSISDDDLCATCTMCRYKPGEVSTCALDWPCALNADGYAVRCVCYSRSF